MKSLFSSSIRMGATNLNSGLDHGTIERKIKSISIHPRYELFPFQFDVAVMEFNEEITFSEYVQQVCLPFLPIDEEQYEDYSPVTMSGYSNVDDSCNESEDFECNSDNLESLKIAKSRVSIYISCTTMV